jgi:DNA-binding HxlR family transcriptional regulator
MKRTSLDEAQCPVARALDTIGDWWSLLIIRDAFDGMTRFGQFQKSLGISRGILSTRLRGLVALGVLEMNAIDDDSGFQEYRLTPKGHDLFVVIVSLRQWGEDHCFKEGESHSVLLENGSGIPIQRLEVRSRNGRVLNSARTFVRKVADTA